MLVSFCFQVLWRGVGTLIQNDKLTLNCKLKIFGIWIYVQNKDS